MILVARRAPVCLAVDTVTAFTQPAIDAVRARGARVAMRYATGPYAIGPAELALLLQNEMGVALYIASRKEGWDPSVATGDADAAAALAHVRTLGIPAGVTLIDDFETPNVKALTVDRIGHLDHAAAGIVAGGFEAGAYLGANCGLTSAEWYERPDVTRYVKSGSRVEDFNGAIVEPLRGYCGVQGLPFNEQVGPIQVDWCFLKEDHMGGRLMLVYDEAHAPAA
jgi:hypothetical protein